MVNKTGIHNSKTILKKNEKRTYLGGGK